MEDVRLKVSDLASILGRLDGGGDIGIELSHQTDIPGVIEVELYELGIKKHVVHEANGSVPRETYRLYPTANMAAAASDDSRGAAGAALDDSNVSRKRPVMEERPLVATAAEDGG